MKLSTSYFTDMGKTTRRLILGIVITACITGVSPAWSCDVGTGLKVQAMLMQMGQREELNASVFYTWQDPWYSFTFDQQMKLMRTVADAEYCASGGRIKTMVIEYNGDRVAEASGGVIRVLKSRP